ncbi:hypothetical protein [Gulosibacter bifidus]|uniref:PKD domain-containing protein n=1 Tax=Gulosibacter bifidus TaxID=272239 RepID=A0ABW5RIH5_9MICO|nr:hypothetical protein [Gulosibacter bifidus]
MFDVCAGTDGTSVDVTITDTQTSPGGSYDASDENSDNTNDAGGEDFTASPADPNAHCEALVGKGSQRCVSRIPRTRPQPVNDAPAPPPLPSTIQVSALANIAPHTATLHMEPNGWAILGRPVNFWTDAKRHTQNATVLGHQVTITFTPDHTVYNYGDGTTQTAYEPGGSWAELGVPELTDTHTSHRYSEKTTHSATATIHYRATVNAAGRSIPVAGTISTTTNALTFQQWEVDIHLVSP